MNKPSGLELVQKHGIKWFCDRYKPKNKEEALVLDYLLQDEYAIEVYAIGLRSGFYDEGTLCAGYYRDDAQDEGRSYGGAGILDSINIRFDL